MWGIVAPNLVLNSLLLSYMKALNTISNCRLPCKISNSLSGLPTCLFAVSWDNFVPGETLQLFIQKHVTVICSAFWKVKCIITYATIRGDVLAECQWVGWIIRHA